MRIFFCVVFCPFVAAIATGCGRTKPELKIAGGITAFQTKARQFAAQRRELVRNRQDLLNRLQEIAADSTAQIEEELGSWRIAGDKDRLRAYDDLLVATRAAAETQQKLDELAAKDAEALQKADTRVKLSHDKLNAVVQALTTLARDQSPKDMLSDVSDYLKSVKRYLDRLESETGAVDKVPDLPPFEQEAVAKVSGTTSTKPKDDSLRN